MIEQQIKTIVGLMEQVTSLSVISSFLKSRGLHHSAGSWAELTELRLIPLVREGKISVEDLINLLGSAEEYGSSHTFLFQLRRPASAGGLLDENRIRTIAGHLGCASVIDTPRVLDQPSSPTISAIRLDHRTRGRCLTIKMIEKREERKYLGEKFTENLIRKEWEIRSVRAVNVVRFYETGLLEVCIQSHTNSTNYESDLSRFGANFYQHFLPPAEFNPFSLHRAKKALWEQRAQNPTHVRFSDSRLRNDSGTVITAATGNDDGDLFADEAATNSMNVFLEHGGRCDEHNIWWVKGADGAIPSKDIHVLLSGKSCEFAVTSNCTREDYEHVLDQLLLLSR